MADRSTSTVERAADAGPVRLSVPAEPSLSRVARLAASGLASLAGCTVDEIENIKIAVSEVLIALIEHGEGARVDLEFEVADAAPAPDSPAAATTAATTGIATADHATSRSHGVFVVRGSSMVSSFDLDHPDLVLCRTVLADVCTSSAIDLVGGAVVITAVVARSEFD